MVKPAFSLEPAQQSDLHALAELRIAAMQESLERIGRFDPERARARLAASFAPACTRHIVVHGVRVGFVVVKPPAVEGAAGHWLLDHLYLHPTAQGRGIGAGVLALVIAEADSADMAVRVGALRDSDANRFYQRCGFVLVEATAQDNYYVRKAHVPLPLL